MCQDYTDRGRKYFINQPNGKAQLTGIGNYKYWEFQESVTLPCSSKMESKSRELLLHMYYMFTLKKEIDVCIPTLLLLINKLVGIKELDRKRSEN